MGADFRAELETTPSHAAASASTAPKATELEGLVAGMREGRVDPTQAVDALVARALESEMARGLTPSARATLEQHLRTMLAEDPAVSQLVRDLERGR